MRQKRRDFVNARKLLMSMTFARRMAFWRSTTLRPRG